MEALALSLVNAVPLLAGVPLWAVTLLLMVMRRRWSSSCSP